MLTRVWVRSRDFFQKMLEPSSVRRRQVPKSKQGQSLVLVSPPVELGSSKAPPQLRTRRAHAKHWWKARAPHAPIRAWQLPLRSLSWWPFLDNSFWAAIWLSPLLHLSDVWVPVEGAVLGRRVSESEWAVLAACPQKSVLFLPDSGCLCKKNSRPGYSTRGN